MSDEKPDDIQCAFNYGRTKGWNEAIEEVLDVATEYFEEGWADSEDQADFLKKIKSLKEQHETKE